MHHTEQLGFEVESSQPQFDGKGKMIDYVNAPPHYAKLSPQPVDVGEAWKLEHHEFAALEYLARAPMKANRIQDLEKAVWWLNRKIALLKSQRKYLPLEKVCEGGWVVKGAYENDIPDSGGVSGVVSQPVLPQGKVSEVVAVNRPAANPTFQELMAEARAAT